MMLAGSGRSVYISIAEQLICRNVKQFREGLVFKAYRLVRHSTLGSRVIKKVAARAEGAEEHSGRLGCFVATPTPLPRTLGIGLR